MGNVRRPAIECFGKQIDARNLSIAIAAADHDFWGRIRNSARANTYAAQTSAADLENARLLAHAGVAADYFQLRGVEQQKRILEGTAVAWQNYLDLTGGR